MYHNIQHSTECLLQSCSSCIRTDQLYTLKWFLRKEKGNKNVNLVFKNNLTNNNKKKNRTEKVPDAAGSHSNKHLVKL